jgi:hypothetical protein
MRFLTLSALFLLFCSHAFSQEYTLSGYVKDNSNGQTIPGASVYANEIPEKGSTTNAKGYYKFILPEGTYHLHVSFISYRDTVLVIALKADKQINFNIQPTIVNEKAVDIFAEKANNNVVSSQMGTITLQTKDIKTIPVFMGEPDILKVIQLLPGVNGAGDANTGLYVRGGGPDQNLVMLDGATVYNAGHLLGFFSVFNSDAVSSVELIKGNMPANYGGRISSVLDIQSKQGDMEHFHVDGGIGLIASHVTVQGPIKKDTAAFIISARRTYIDLFMGKPFITPSSGFYGTKYYFYDLNATVNYRFSEKNSLSLTGYFGRDAFNFNDATAGFGATIPWGNAIAALTWRHIFSDKLLMTTSLDFTDYSFSFTGTETGVTGNFTFALFSGIHDYQAKWNFDWLPNPKHHIKYGLEYIFHVFVPSAVSAQEQSVNFNTSSIDKLYANEAGVYITDDYDLTERFRVSAGLRYSIFQQVGPFNRYVQDAQGNTIDTVQYKTLQNVAFYQGVEPRVSMRYQLTTDASVKGGYSRNYQYIHLASISSISLPTDIWFPSTSIVKPSYGDQYAIGIYKNFDENTYETSVETYYKSMHNLIEYKDGVTPEANISSNPDENFTFGTGQAYGVELFLKKRLGKFNGWIGYTLAWTTENFPDLNNGQPFYAKYDRRHDLSVVANYRISDRWTFSGVFVFATGEALTLPIAWYLLEGTLVEAYGARNSYRLAPYDRLDLAATYTPDRIKRQEKRKERWEMKAQKKSGTDTTYVDHRPKWIRNMHSSWTFSVYNAYNRYNPYFIYFDISGNLYNGTLNIQAKQVSLFPVLPAVTWNFQF